MFRIGKFMVDPGVFDVFPESLAREDNLLPIGFRGRSLRVVAGKRPEAELTAALKRAAYIILLGFHVWLADAAEVKRLVDELYSLDATEIAGCPLKFTVRCPRKWLEMRPTDQPDIRHCDVCTQSVYLVKDEDEGREHARQGHCIALIRKDCIDIGLAAFDDAANQR
jgi:hypothetical protein